MNNSTIIPLVALTAAAAFGLGWVARSDSANSDQAANPDDANTRQRVISSDNRGSGGSASGGSAESRFLSKYLQEGEILSEDMTAAIKELSETNDPLLRQKMLALLLEKLTPENAKDAFLALQKNRRGGPMGRGGDDGLRLLANAWGRIDGAGAIAALKEMSEAMGDEGGRGGRGGPSGLGREMISALSGWATADSGAAIAHFEGLEDGMEKRFGAAGIIQGMLVNGVDDAMGFVQSLPEGEGDGREKGYYMSMIAGEMIEQGLDTAQSWASTVTDPKLRSGAFTEVTRELMRDDREAAAEYIVKNGEDEAIATAANRLADSWAREDPKAVLKWADDLSGQAKAEAYEEAVESWVRESPEEVAEFIGDLDPSPERDSAVGAFAERVANDDPVAAMEWADTISNADLKLETQIDVARDWYRDDKTAANEWIAAANLPEETVKRITESGRGGGSDFRGRGGRGGGR
jgi:hypothetical protein